MKRDEVVGALRGRDVATMLRPRGSRRVDEANPTYKLRGRDVATMLRGGVHVGLMKPADLPRV